MNVVQEVEDEPLHVERVAALDVGKGMVEVCIRVPSDRDRRRRAQEVRTFGTTKKEIVALADWLRCWGVNTVVMESTGDYWKAPFFRLEAEGFACELLDAKQVKALPGRPKTDRCDAVWLAKVTERGMGVGSCFVPSEEIRRLRTLTRYRRHLIEERSREKQRSEKLLEDAMIKLSVVVSDLHGVSARDIMEALIGGQRDPKALAQLARGKMRNKILALEEALDGADTFTGHHAFVLRMMLDNIDHITAQINGLTSRIEELIAPFERQVVQLDGIPGMGRIAAQDLLAEIGADMSVFRTAGHLVSWCKFCPQVKQSAGKRKGRNSKGRGNRYVAGVLGEVTVSAGRSKTRIGARYRRIARRRGKPKAQVACGNTILSIAHTLLSDPALDYEELGVDYYDTRVHHKRQISSHIRGLQRLGYRVTLEPLDTGGAAA
ncbi:IS110 family RNA-guided transposase [Nonomuraea angiospora]|uniref:IS110 family transposase n=1 Tax=Nonomuraea angiospora TaxID=46172 RepID=UPI0029B42BE1|nr:IS110 family transposase [Nonomuraea angiospora]MDX3111686.1 IS110 family transposase [Nonomuraea angiospora]